MTTMAAAAVPPAPRRAVPHRAAPPAKRAAVAVAKRAAPRAERRKRAAHRQRPEPAERTVAWAAPARRVLAGAKLELVEWAQAVRRRSFMLAARPRSSKRDVRPMSRPI